MFRVPIIPAPFRMPQGPFLSQRFPGDAPASGGCGAGKGAGFDMVDHTQFFWNILATDGSSKLTGRCSAIGWVQGWSEAIGLGRHIAL